MTRDRALSDSHSRLLLRLSGSRLSGALRNPSASFIVGAALPALVVTSALVTLGLVGVPSTNDASGGLTLGLLVSGMISFVAYGVLFGPADTLFLMHLGTSPRALFVDRAGRLALVGAATVAGVLLPYLAAGAEIGRVAVIAVGAAGAAVGVATLAYAKAARSMTFAESARSYGIQWDPELAKAAPLVYAPLAPFFAGTLAGTMAGGLERGGWVIAALALGVVVLGTFASARAFDAVAGRFLPRVGEMAFAPPPEAGGEGFRVGRGLSALLPRRAAAAWVRDALVGSRRFGWATRISWPVALVSAIALARWGESEAMHVWVFASVGIVLVIQGAAVVGLGLHERRGPGWLDRVAGVRWWERFLGRLAWSWGMSLWLLIPVALAWWWWSGAPNAWAWPAGGVISALLATSVSLLDAQRR